MAQEKKKRDKDPFFRLKYIAYCLSQSPPDSVKTDFSDFVNYAKFQVCQSRNILLEDPVWERYTDEQILVEYYAIMFSQDEKLRQNFDADLAGADKDTIDWMTHAVEANTAELAKIKKGETKENSTDTAVAEEVEEEFTFEPEVMDE